MEELKQILEKFGITPKNIDLYQTAFIHRSFLNENKSVPESNERLEFLGDAVLSIIVSTYLYEQRRSDAEGDLTSLRAFIVKTQSLAKISKDLELGKLLKLSKGEDMTGGRDNSQLLANTYEALLGAIYLDQGIGAATNFVQKTIIPKFSDEITHGAPKDSKSQLQELAQSKFQQSPKYKILDTSGPDHAKEFNVGVFIGEQIYGEGVGTNKQVAEELAATMAIEKINKST